MNSAAVLSSAEEDYLLAIARNEGPVKTSELARRLDVSDPSVTLMISKLASKGLVKRRSHKPIDLTEEGRSTAALLVRRHRLLELFLTTTLSYGWEEVHLEAHRIEHAVSDKFIERLDSFLGRPESDPHGAPIPDPSGIAQKDGRIPLCELAIGSAALIVEVDDENAELLAYLGDLGLVPGVNITFVELSPFDGPVHLKVHGKMVSIGRLVAAAIQVKSIQ